MTPQRLQKLLVVLLAFASLSTTALVVLTVVRHRARAAEPPVLFDLPEFTLTERSGEPFGSADLRGKVWIANFIYRRCTTACPMITSQMAAMQIELSKRPDWPDIRLVSFSVEPDHDTAEVLREYARFAHADPAKWLFLTGSRDALYELIIGGFKLPVGENTGPTAAGDPILHSQKFVLVDRQGRIRGYYEGTDDSERQKLLNDLNRVLRE